MDKEWMSKNRLSREYEDGVELFLHFAVQNASDPNAIHCPCVKCGNLRKKSVDIIRTHLTSNGMDQTYTKWIWHGERSTKRKPMDANDEVGQELKKEGKLKIEGAKEDILTKALEKPEHPGRVRGLGKNVNPSMYFNFVPGKKQVDQWLRSEQRKELVDAKKLIAEQGARIEEQNVRLEKQNECLEKLEGILNKDEEKASCSRHQSNKDEDDEADFIILDRKVALEGSAVALTLESTNEIAAFGAIVHVDGPVNFLHDEPLPTNCMCIAIDEAMDESAPLPIKISRMCACLGDGVGNHVAWHAQLIKLKNEKSGTIKVGDGKNNSKVVKSKMPRELFMFYCCCKNVLDGKSVRMTLDNDVFGIEKEIYVDISDITHFCELEPISCFSIIVYIWHLYKKMKEKYVDKFLFVDPYGIEHVPTTRTDKNYIQQLTKSRARFLANRLGSASSNQLVLAPCNIGFHWILTVIDPYNEIVYVLDPIGPRIRNDTWRDVVNLALKLFNVGKGRNGKKQPQCDIIAAPIQPDEKQCGFYVLRYMREILHE